MSDGAGAVSDEGKTGKGKQMVGAKQHDLLAMPTPVLANGVPPNAQLRGSYGGSKPGKDAAAKAIMKKIFASPEVKQMTKEANEARPHTIINRHGGKTKEQAEEEAKAKKSGAGKEDGRKRRAEIVKRIMKEKGMKMIDASKYVKEHNLYKA
jgi:hypothetical protein